MKKIGIFCLILLVLLCQNPAAAADYAAPDMSVTSGCNTIDAMAPLLGNQQAVSNATAAFLYEVNTDTLMYSYNADNSVPPSSLLKILTALIAIEKGNLTDVVTVQEEVLKTLPNDAVVVELQVDEVVTVKDLLYCMMVGSGNDAAVVLANHVMGSQKAFVEEMNRYAESLGCTGTHFVNVHGLHHGEQVTTARDVAKILKKALENETFREVFGAIRYTVEQTNKSESRHLSSQNYLMNNDKDINYFDERVTGSRTAVANDRSRSVASVSQVGDMELISVVIGSESVYEEDGYTIKVYGGFKETTQLLDMGFDGYKTAQIIHKNQIVLQNTVAGGSSDISVGSYEDACSVIPANAGAQELSYRYVDEEQLSLPIEKGQRISTLQVWCGTVCIAQTELYAMNSVVANAEQFGGNTTDNSGGGFFTILLYVLGAGVIIVLLGFVVLSLIRAVRIARLRNQRRRSRRNRRRSR